MTQESEIPDVTQHLGWAYKMALPHARRQSIDVEDSEEFADACLCLVNCSRTFDSSLGYKFITYAGTSISNAISTGIRERTEYRKLGRQLVKFHQGENMGDYCDNRVEEKRFTSDQIDALIAAVEVLPERNRLVVQGRLASKTLQEIGDDMMITRERVRQIEMQSHIMLWRAIEDIFVLED